MAGIYQNRDIEISKVREKERLAEGTQRAGKDTEANEELSRTSVGKKRQARQCT